jgi:hypothetical protein
VKKERKVKWREREREREKGDRNGEIQTDSGEDRQLSFEE